MGRYSTLVKAGKVFHASAIITAPVVFTTADQLVKAIRETGRIPVQRDSLYRELALPPESPTSRNGIPSPVTATESAHSAVKSTDCATIGEPV